MRQVTRKSLMTVAAATGVIAAVGGYAHADSAANGSASHSPGVLSGNTVQAPIDVPVNVCGNTVDVVGILNPAMGNACTNQSADTDDDGNGGSGGAHADGHANDSSGVASGNHVEAPVHVPVNVCGNSVDVVGVLNPTRGNDCVNESGSGADHGTPPGGDPETPAEPGPAEPGPAEPGPAEPGPAEPGPAEPGPAEPADFGDGPTGPQGAPSTPERMTPAGNSTAHRPAQTSSAQLAETGSELPLGLALPAGAGMLLAGAVLYRKARASM
ncbi:chaplin family protein [Streptomyces sp. NPDC052015]|uniref:chaplin n=1 Tax=Streptomyces sp. NPDC052015 TaxID=3154755 RepID=UPI003423B323